MKTVAWLIPEISAGSGGKRTVLAHAKALEERGYSCVLYAASRASSAESARGAIRDAYGYDFEHVRLGWHMVEPCDAVFATIWPSAGLVAGLPFKTKKLYFCQDYEVWMYPAGSSACGAEMSYQYGLEAITIGRFLARKLSEAHGARASYYDFGVNRNIYKPLEEAATEPAVCFVYQPEKERRCAALGLEALEIARALRPEARVFLFGTPKREETRFPAGFEHLGLLSLPECNALYNNCRVGVCLSATNPSRVPFEMMSAGLPVVDLWRENTLYDYRDNTILLARQTPQAIATAIIKLLDDEALRENMRKAGLAFVRGRTEEDETSAFADLVDAVFEQGKLPEPKEIRRMYNGRPVENMLHALRR